ncbi:MAG: hypothetical protein FWB74_01610 [Defluviitaleaceae bacterium]|nr:hypothetical protein [Defluviitaleaceae bacterium]
MYKLRRKKKQAITQTRINIDIEKSTAEFMERLENGYYTMPTLPNDGNPFSAEKTARQSAQLDAWLDSDLAKEFNEMV